MSYYTSYNLSIFRHPTNVAWDDLPWDALYLAVVSIDGGIFEEWTQGEWGCNAKWYSQDADMWKLSVQFPDLLFLLHGDGEDGDDVWDEYWQNGACQHCHMVIPPYDASKMRQYELNEDGTLAFPRAEDKSEHIKMTLPDL